MGSPREHQRGKYHCTVDLLFDLFGLACFANKNKKLPSCHTADTKPVKQEVNSTVILPPLVFPVKLVEIIKISLVCHKRVGEETKLGRWG